MEKRELICISCPMGCRLSVDMEDGIVSSVSGNGCGRGDIYARKELINPTRIVCSSVTVEGGSAPRVSVKTGEDIPKDRIFDCMRALKHIVVKAPVYIGDVILNNVAGTGVDIVATGEA